MRCSCSLCRNDAGNDRHNDSGGEFRVFASVLAQLGIKQRLSCPHTSQQNGLVERKHRHIVEHGLSMLAQANLPLHFWSDAFLSATFLINRLPTKVLNFISPYEKLYGKKPDYNFLKVFGCLCYPCLRPYNAHKLDYRSQPCLFLGYSPLHHGYKCRDQKGRIYYSRHVVFDETTFPYPSPVAKPTYPPPFQSPPIPVLTAPQPPTPSVSPSSLPEPLPITSHSSSFPSPPSTDSLSQSSPSTSHIPTTPTPTSSTLNTHPMVTRAKDGTHKPKILLTTIPNTDTTPSSIHEALTIPSWADAVRAELGAMQDNETWSLVELPPGRKVVGCKWVFKVKHNADGSVARHKARLVAKGYSQIPGQDYDETFSPVVKTPTVHLLLSIALKNQWSLRQVDINNAFLKGDLKEEIYMMQPPGFEQYSANGGRLVCKLHKAIYGLRQAPRSWFAKLRSFLEKQGFRSSKADPSLFILNTDKVTTFLVVYVDDIVITGNSPDEIEKLVTLLDVEFSIKDLGLLSYFLGIDVKYHRDGLLLSQRSYILEILERAQMTNANATPTPMASNLKLSKDNGTPFEDPRLYRSIVGALQYVCHTRPDIAFSVNKVAQFMHRPLDTHWIAVKRILRYLRGSLDHGLWFTGNTSFTLTAFSDADWGSDVDDRRSTSGYCIYLGANLVSWSSKKQRSVSRSTAEAEYRSLADAASEVTWLTSILLDMGITLTGTPVLWCDNTSTVAMAANSVLHGKTKHVDLDLHFVQERVQSQKIQVQYVSANAQTADVLTKPLAVTFFPSLRSKLNVLVVDDQKMSILNLTREGEKMEEY